MELRAIKVELFKEDEEPQFNIDEIYEKSNTLKNYVQKLETPFRKKQFLNASKLSEAANSNNSHISSILNSPEKVNAHSLKKKNSQFQSISPEKSIFKSKFTFHRPVFSANKTKKMSTMLRGEIAFDKTSYSPTLSPQRNSMYWFLPMNSTMRQKNYSQPLKITAQSYCVMTTDTNEIVASQNINSQRQIASLTKIMTAYTVLNICSTFGIKIRQHYVSVNKQAAYMNGTSAGLKVDEEILIIDLLYALLLPSGNDAGVALAQYFGKFLSYKFAQDTKSNQQKTSMEKFEQFKYFYDTEYDKQSVKLFLFEMNNNCHKIGLKNTHFNNSTGLSDKRNYSTARDMAVLTGHCLKNHNLRMIFKKKFHTCQVRNNKLCRTRQMQWKNTNRHLFQFRQCIGIKTGITPNAGPCLSSAYKVLGREIVVIVLECQSVQARYKDSQALFKWCRTKIRAF